MKKVIKAAGSVGFATIISRIFGFIRDMLVANIVGTGMYADAFFVAFRIPNLLRRLVAEGAMSAAFIPVFTEYLTTKKKDEAYILSNTIITLLIILCITLTIIGIIFSPQIVTLISPGFTENIEKFNHTVYLTRIIFPFIFFIGLSAAVMGILHSMKIFFIPSISSAFFNIALIASILTLSDYCSPSTALAIGVLAGGFFQLAVQVPTLIKKGYKFFFKLDLKDPGVRKVGRLFIPATIGIAPYQISIIVDTFLASFLVEGSVSYLFYGNRLVQFPLAIFGIATSIVILPILSEYFAKKDFDKIRETLTFSIKFVLLITIPASLGLIILKTPIVNTLFERGEFDKISTQGTGDALLYYSIGLCAFSGIKILVSCFYSMQDTKTPVKIASFCLLLNIVLNILLMGPLKHGGLALGTSISSIINLFILIFALKKRIGNFFSKDLISSISKSFIASILMSISIYFLTDISFNFEAGTVKKSLVLCSIIFAGIVLYIIISLLIKNEEMKYLVKLLREKIKTT